MTTAQKTERALRALPALRVETAHLARLDPIAHRALPAKDIKVNRRVPLVANALRVTTARLTVAALRESRAPITAPVLLDHLSSPLKLLPNLFRFLERFRKR